MHIAMLVEINHPLALLGKKNKKKKWKSDEILLR